MKKILYKTIENYFTQKMSKGRGDFKRTIHASEILQLCPRKEMLQQKYKIKEPHKEALPFGLSITFAIGRAVEGKIRESLGNNLIGPETMCWNYQELNLQVEKYGFTFSGSMDAIFKYEDISVPIEIKSISPDQFDELVEPLIQHRFQCQTYLWLIKNNKKHQFVKTNGLSHDKCYIIYISKTAKNNPIKIFEIKLDIPYVNLMKEHLTQFKLYSETGGLPQRSCLTEKSKSAKKCMMCKHCFEEK